MVLLQIAEPGAAPEVHRERQIGVGIDLGTTNSLIAHFNGTDLNVLADDAGQASLPSVVYYSTSQTLVGSDAEQHASVEPGNTIASAKRMLGRSREEFEDDPYIQLAAGESLAFATDAGAKTPVEVSAAILGALKDRAGPQLSGPIRCRDHGAGLL